MTHDDVLDHLQALHRGDLDESERRAVETHLAGCGDCRSLSETVRTLQHVTPTGDVDPDHPFADEIVAYALDPGTLHDGDRDWIRTHVRRCRTCAEDLERVVETERRMASDDLDAKRTVRRWRPTASAYAIAASLLVALLAYPAYLGLTGAGRSSAGSRAWTGPFDLPVVGSALRGDSGTHDLILEPEVPFVALGVDVRVPADLRDSDRLRFRIVAETAPPRDVVAIEMAVEEARRHVRSTGVVTLAVATTRLEAGAHALVVDVASRPDLPRLLESRLNVLDRGSERPAP